LICPKCRNEKLAQDVCPQCGLPEREALLQAAQSFRQAGKISSAIGYLDRCLHLGPGDTEALRQKAVCLYLEAIKSRELKWFDQANQTLVLELEKDWNWEPGHQYRIDLFSSFGRLKELEEEYLQTQTSDPVKKTICADMLKIIRLTRKFKEETLLTAESEPNNKWSWLKTMWPLGLLPFAILAMFMLSAAARSKETGYLEWIPYLWMLLGISVIFLFLFTMKLVHDNKKRK
jgi:hypothetical protein